MRAVGAAAQAFSFAHSRAKHTKHRQHIDRAASTDRQSFSPRVLVSPFICLCVCFLCCVCTLKQAEALVEEDCSSWSRHTLRGESRVAVLLYLLSRAWKCASLLRKLSSTYQTVCLFTSLPSFVIFYLSVSHLFISVSWITRLIDASSHQHVSALSVVWLEPTD